MEVTIIGAGPAGSYLAYLLSSQGVKVELYEEHGNVGKPVQCTGILTKDIETIKPLRQALEDYTINRITSAMAHAPDRTSLHLKLATNYIIDRAGFDRAIADKATKAGARLHTSHKLESVDKGILRFNHKGKRLKKGYDVLVGADGPGSVVNRSLFRNQYSYWIGSQARVQLKNDNSVRFFMYPKGYSWVVPESSEIVRAGIVAEKDPKDKLEGFLNEIACSKVIDRQAGLIPRYDPKARTSSGNAFLVGDAASQVKATTGGGIVPGLMAAEELCKALITGKDYAKAWKRRVGRSLWLHLQMRKILDNMESGDYSRLFKSLSAKKVRKVLEKSDREDPARFIWKMALLKPGLITYARFLRN